MSQIHERYAKIKALVPNEIREEIGMPQIDGGDKPIELNARQAADDRANTAQNRERDSQRANEQSDGPAAISGRNPKGEGSKTE
jgi:hypothetical protein